MEKYNSSWIKLGRKGGWESVANSRVEGGGGGGGGDQLVRSRICREWKKKTPWSQESFWKNNKSQELYEVIELNLSVRSTG